MPSSLAVNCVSPRWSRRPPRRRSSKCWRWVFPRWSRMPLPLVAKANVSTPSSTMPRHPLMPSMRFSPDWSGVDWNTASNGSGSKLIQSRPFQVPTHASEAEVNRMHWIRLPYWALSLMRLCRSRSPFRSKRWNSSSVKHHRCPLTGLILMNVPSFGRVKARPASRPSLLFGSSFPVDPGAEWSRQASLRLHWP